MTARPPLHADDEFVSLSLQERVARARRSIVAIRAGALSATGWVALPNGAVVTSRRAIGYPSEIALALEDGMPVAGRVIVADVARDVAVILPLEVPSGASPLPIRLADARLGEPALALSCLPGQSLRFAAGRICQVRRSGGQPLVGFDIDVAAPLGAPLLDTEGRVVGLLAASPRAAGEASASPGLPGGASALPAAALAALLASIDRPALELRERAPIYRCPGCEEPYDVAADRCLGCGRALPHGFAPCAARAQAERLVREGLAAIGQVANRARVGPRVWRFLQRPFSTAEATMVELEIDEEGRTLTVRAPVVSLPAANHEPFYRFLLTMNDQTTGELGVSVSGDVVSVSCVEELDDRAEPDVAARIDEVVRVADEYRRTLADTFEATPRYELGR